MDVDLKAIEEKWLRQCGPCDYGMPEYGCTHPGDDYRPVLVSLIGEIERLRGVDPVNDIDATGECCCSGCIGEGPCDLGEECDAGCGATTVGGGNYCGSCEADSLGRDDEELEP